ncbi:Cytoplasmic polyadenylation element-binding protein 4 [Trichostrongylus colubriformis]|uniref:Cytoplasmic polyadenylation element-binding protein 4 n=1 Tax=Trichostrongylus colubriformis TaxID=6319 RepID=A0AAN8EY17_TRICO
MDSTGSCLECEKLSLWKSMTIERLALLLGQMKWNIPVSLPDDAQLQPLSVSLPPIASQSLTQFNQGWNGPSTPSTFPDSENNEVLETVSRKVFVGGLPQDINKDTLLRKFSAYGCVHLDFPSEPTHLPRTKKVDRKLSTSGYVFLVYENEDAVLNLLRNCISSDGSFFMLFTEDCIVPKWAQVRPWYLSSIAHIPDPDSQVDPRLTVFIGGVPRPLAAQELASLLEENFGKLVYCEIDVDPDLLYPKGAARAVFASYAGYVKAIQTRYLQIPNFEFNKRNVEIKPYIMDNEDCDECLSACSEEFCRLCLQYYCRLCYTKMHLSPDAATVQGGQEYVVTDYPQASASCYLAEDSSGVANGYTLKKR